MKLELFASTDVGKLRPHNEDNFVVCENLSTNSWKFSNEKVIEVGEKGSILFVADGMGGTNAGEVASHIAQETVQQELSILSNAISDIPNTLNSVLLQAHRNIIQKQKADPGTAGMGTTAILAWVLNGRLQVSWVGDSRAYLIRKGMEPKPLTDDHSWVWEMVKKKKMTPEEARVHPDSNIITQQLGDEKQTPKPDFRSFTIQSGDIIILCSDGLNGMLSDEEIFRISTADRPLPEIVRDLIDEANNQGGEDNITVVAAKVHQIDSSFMPETIITKKRFKVNRFLMIVLFVGLVIIAYYFFADDIKNSQRTQRDSIFNDEINPIVNDTPIAKAEQHFMDEAREQLDEVTVLDEKRKVIPPSSSFNQELKDRQKEFKILKDSIEKEIFKIEKRIQEISIRDKSVQQQDSLTRLSNDLMKRKEFLMIELKEKKERFKRDSLAITHKLSKPN
jgi:serine/threonine protein phosphatase PrpC